MRKRIPQPEKDLPGGDSRGIGVLTGFVFKSFRKDQKKCNTVVRGFQRGKAKCFSRMWFGEVQERLQVQTIRKKIVVSMKGNWAVPAKKGLRGKLVKS